MEQFNAKEARKICLSSIEITPEIEQLIEDIKDAASKGLVSIEVTKIPKGMWEWILLSGFEIELIDLDDSGYIVSW